MVYFFNQVSGNESGNLRGSLVILLYGFTLMLWISTLALAGGKQQLYIIFQYQTLRLGKSSRRDQGIVQLDRLAAVCS